MAYTESITVYQKKESLNEKNQKNYVEQRERSWEINWNNLKQP